MAETCTEKEREIIKGLHCVNKEKKSSVANFVTLDSALKNVSAAPHQNRLLK
jgi:hypothetical protein